MSKIGDTIAKRRKELGMTQEDLAKLMGYKSKSTINKIELGINDIVQSKVVKFAAVLNTTTSYLMGWTDNPNKEAATENGNGLSESRRKLIEFAQNCSEQDADKLLRVIDILTDKK